MRIIFFFIINIFKRINNVFKHFFILKDIYNLHFKCNLDLVLKKIEDFFFNS